jgi:hypothetical protein
LHPFAAYAPLIYLRIDFGSVHLGPVQHSKAPSWTGWAHRGTFRHRLVVSLAFAFRVLLEVSLELEGLQLNEIVGMFDVILWSLLYATCVYDVLSGGLHSFHSLQGKYFGLDGPLICPLFCFAYTLHLRRPNFPRACLLLYSNVRFRPSSKFSARLPVVGGGCASYSWYRVLFHSSCFNTPASSETVFDYAASVFDLSKY